ncbi:MAG: DNA primase [Bacillota bacterium]
MRYFSDDFIEQVREQNDIIDLISDYLRLENSGSNYKGLCPFHDEDTPSFMVSPHKQLYHCFGCGAGGNIFNFLMEIEQLEFVEAVEVLAKRAGLSLPQQSQQAKEQQLQKSELYQIHDWAVKFFNYLLTETEQGQEAYRYLKNRDFTDEIIDQFQLGYAPDSWHSLFNFLKKKGYSAQKIQQAGLIIPQNQGQGYYDRFRNRIMFTISNLRGQVVGFGGRVLDDTEPKYLNSPQTPIFNKKDILYGLNLAKQQIRRSGSAIIVEGYTDMITGYQYGIENLVASLGTSLTRRQARLLKRYADRVYIAYDGDAAGESATLRGLEILKQVGVEVYIVDLPTDSDPDEVIKEEGAKHFTTLVDQAQPLLEFKIESLLTNRELNKIEEKVTVADEVIPILAEIDNEIEQAEYIKRVADKLAVESKVVKSRLNNYLQQNNQQDRNYRTTNTKDKSATQSEDNQSSTENRFEFEEELFRLMLKDQRILNLVQEELASEDFISSEYQRVVELIFASDLDQLKWDELIQQVDSSHIRSIITELSIDRQHENGANTYYFEEAKGYIKKIKEYQLKMEKEKLDEEIQKFEASNQFDKVRDLLRQRQEVSQLLQQPDDLLGSRLSVRGEGE